MPASMYLIDSHCHLDFAEFDADRATVLQQAVAQRVSDIIVPGVSAQQWPAQIALCNAHPMLHYALGLHPVFLPQHQSDDVEKLTGQLANSKAVAVGEIGLDFLLRDLDRTRQLRLFTAQLMAAKQHHLPVILHVRKAHDEVLGLLKKHPVAGGIVHAFNGSMQHAENYLKAGFKLGFGGMLTYPRSRKLRALAKALPLTAIVLETDAPDMTVASHRGQRNSPAYLPEVALSLASIRQQSLAEIISQTSLNTREVLSLPH